METARLSSEAALGLTILGVGLLVTLGLLVWFAAAFWPVFVIVAALAAWVFHPLATLAILSLLLIG